MAQMTESNLAHLSEGSMDLQMVTDLVDQKEHQTEHRKARRLEYQMASMTEAKKADPKELNLALMKVNWMAQMWERHWDASKVQLSESLKVMSSGVMTVRWKV
jgi:hypothetical protein